MVNVDRLLHLHISRRQAFGIGAGAVIATSSIGKEDGSYLRYFNNIDEENRLELLNLPRFYTVAHNAGDFPRKIDHVRSAGYDYIEADYGTAKEEPYIGHEKYIGPIAIDPENKIPIRIGGATFCRIDYKW